jgi:hypothetical protein
LIRLIDALKKTAGGMAAMIIVVQSWPNYPRRSIERGDDGERRVAVSATHPLSTPEWRLRIESLVALMAVQRNNHRNHLRRIFKWVSTDENRIASREGLGIRPGDGLAIPGL